MCVFRMVGAGRPKGFLVKTKLYGVKSSKSESKSNSNMDGLPRSDFQTKHMFLSLQYTSALGINVAISSFP